jgi:glyoxylase I family protein
MPACLAPAVHHLAILVSDLARVEHFYTKVLGLDVLRRWPDAAGTAERSLWLQLGHGAFLALERAPSDAQPRKAEGAPGHHLLALGIAEKDRNNWRKRLAEAGQPVTHETAFSLYFTDPEGNRLALSHWPEAASDTAMESP